MKKRGQIESETIYIAIAVVIVIGMAIYVIKNIDRGEDVLNVTEYENLTGTKAQYDENGTPIGIQRYTFDESDEYTDIEIYDTKTSYEELL